MAPSRENQDIVSSDNQEIIRIRRYNHLFIPLILRFFTPFELINLFSEDSKFLEQFPNLLDDYIWKPHFEEYFLNTERREETYYSAFIIRSNSLLAAAKFDRTELLLDASDQLKTDPDFSKEFIKQNPLLLEYGSEGLKDNEQFVLSVVKQNGLALQFASEELRDNAEVVLEAVKQDGFALRLASEGLRDNAEVVLEAVKQHGSALKYASEELRGNAEFFLEAVKQHGSALKYASEELRGNAEVVLEAVKQEYCAGYNSLTSLKGEEIVFPTKGTVMEIEAPFGKHRMPLDLVTRDASDEVAKLDLESILEFAIHNGWVPPYASAGLKYSAVAFTAIDNDAQEDSVQSVVKRSGYLFFDGESDEEKDDSEDYPVSSRYDTI